MWEKDEKNTQELPAEEFSDKTRGGTNQLVSVKLIEYGEMFYFFSIES